MPLARRGSELTTNHSPLSISRGMDTFVSSAAVLEGLAQHAARLPSRQRPADRLMRDALGVAVGLAEVQREQGGAGEWQSGVRADLTWLGEHLSMAEAEAEAALEFLVRAQIVRRELRGSREWLYLEPAVLDEIPGLARLAWDEARARIDAAGGSRRPALAVLGEIARLSGAVDAEGRGAWSSMTHQALCAATFYQQTAIANALQVLENAELVERHTRAGRRGGNQYRTLAAAYGHGGSPVIRPDHEAARAPERGWVEPGNKPTGEPPVASARAPGAGAWLQIGDGPRVWVPAEMVAIPSMSDRGEITIRLQLDP